MNDSFVIFHSCRAFSCGVCDNVFDPNHVV